MSTPSGPLKRFPFSTSELVEVSPFTSTNGPDTRYFVGRKETSLILMELETGKIKATLNSECPADLEGSLDADLDELEASKPLISAPTEVYIGRTDYTISIYKKPTGPNASNPHIHNLSFSTYGPNDRDSHLQTHYRKTNDNSYVQSLPNGEIIAFRSRTPGANESKERDGIDSPLWGQHFKTPIVAIFDILQAPPIINSSKPHPFVLLQPRPRLPYLFPPRSFSHRHLPNLEAVYVGLVEETRSLFAMSPEAFPLVVFGGNEPKGKPRTTGDRCMLNPYDLRCFIGARQVEDGDGPDGRLKRLLDGPPPEFHKRQGSAAPPISTIPVSLTPADDNLRCITRGQVSLVCKDGDGPCFDVLF